MNRQAIRARRAQARKQQGRPVFNGPGASQPPMPEMLKHAAVDLAVVQQKLQVAQARMSVSGLAVDAFERLIERRGPLTDEQQELYTAASEEHNVYLDKVAELACEMLVAMDEVDKAQTAQIVAPDAGVPRESALQIVT